MIGGVGRVLARGRLLAAAHVLAADDPVVVAAVHPGHQLLHPAHGERVAAAQLHPAAREPVQALAALVEVLGLAQERVEVELRRRGAARERHQRAAHGQRVAGTSAAARSQLSSAARNHSPSASRTAASGSATSGAAQRQSR